ncbi:hypothetical protein [Actinotalea subterranea]|uniref:hypothetical protein n=1 Tax=Actinotalea subterranea TaxID=2607497 RepID=UPI001CAA86AB|nr:hypothetical protein [Actinotalea subterranea]
MSRMPSPLRALPALVLPAVLAVGCGVQPSGVVDAADAPTGVAPGPTLYFVDADGALRPEVRETGRLGTIPEALTLLLIGPGPGSGDVHTEIRETEVTRVEVTTTDSSIALRMPLTVDDVTPAGIDQVVCTALGVHVQGGGSTRTTVRIEFVQLTPESDVDRTCPLIG